MFCGVLLKTEVASLFTAWVSVSVPLLMDAAPTGLLLIVNPVPSPKPEMSARAAGAVAIPTHTAPAQAANNTWRAAATDFTERLLCISLSLLKRNDARLSGRTTAPKRERRRIGFRIVRIR